MCIDIDETNFDEEVLHSPEPVLVDFWAPWCQFCLMISPEVEQAAQELDGKVKVCKLNCDEARDLAVNCGVSSIPALHLFVGGEVKDKLIGFTDKDKILDFIEKNISTAPHN